MSGKPLELKVSLDAKALSEIFREVSPALADVLDERIRQDQKYGGPDNDDAYQEIDWCRIIAGEVGQADRVAWNGRAHGKTWRTRMVRIAALAIAAVQSHDRKEEEK